MVSFQGRLKLGEHLGVDACVLANVEGVQPEAERVDLAQQWVDKVRGQPQPAMRSQAFVKQQQIAFELDHAAVSC